MRFQSSNNGNALAKIVTVIMIIGALAGIALYSYGRILQQRKADEATPILLAMYEAQQVYFKYNGDYTNNINHLGLEFTMPQHFTSIDAIPGNSPVTCSTGETDDILGRAVPKDGSANIYLLKNGHICSP